MSQLASTVSKLESKGKLPSQLDVANLNPPRKDKAKDEELLEIFKKVEINLPLLSAVQQIPKYAKFLKELCTKKRRHSDKENIIVSQNAYELIKKDMPKKSLDLGRPFMKTVKAILDIDKGSLSIEFGGDRISFNINESMKYPMENFFLNYLDSFKYIPMACDSLFGNHFENYVLEFESFENLLYDEYASCKNSFCDYDHTCVNEGNVCFEENSVLDESLFELDYELALGEDENSTLDSLMYLDKFI
ncbi:reverse transcriptase [Cucumis melo var. makuwa]|uniref:Reverse transcriptase n=1 Tax=Cucumis melo var. makuwa TaxID=1194695 RepID=A0A5A7TXB3_CUCMM|nr:reverse transcriptase [Cucumis melo var. makuwa]